MKKGLLAICLAMTTLFGLNAETFTGPIVEDTNNIVKMSTFAL